MRFGICATVQETAALPDVTFDYLEVTVQGFLVPEQPDEVFEAHLQQAKQLPVPIEAANSLLPGDLALIATPERPVDTERIERYMRTALDRAAKTGIRVIVFGSGVARACPEGYSKEAALEQLSAYLVTWSRWGRAQGVQIVLEPLRYEETNTLNTVNEAGMLVSRVADSGARLLADTYHMACNGEDPRSILDWGSYLAHVHVAEQQERAAPGRFGEDLQPYFRQLHQAGYDRRISIECRWVDLAQEVAPAIQTLRAQWATSALR